MVRLINSCLCVPWCELCVTLWLKNKNYHKGTQSIHKVTLRFEIIPEGSF
jgi:hypothetical protein